MSTFPLKNKFLTKSEIMIRFKSLSKFNINLSNRPFEIYNVQGLFPVWKKFYEPKPRFALMDFDETNYHTLDEISDFFTEHLRIKAKRFDNPLSLEEYWEKNKGKYSHIKDLYTLREKLSEDFYEVGSFRPTIMATLIEYFGATKVLDFSAGWGDRLIGAISKGVEYTGVDPNSALHPEYKNIIEMLAEDSSKYVMIDSGFEDAVLPKGKTYNLVLTSPPYFDLEIYSDDPNQSHHYGNDWFEKFLMVSLKKAWSVLEIGGHMCVVINDKKGTKDPFILNMIKRVNMYLDSIFLGLIGYAKKGSKSAQPIWVWRKQEPISYDNKVKIEPIKVGDKTFNIIQEGYLPGGTKQRMYKAFEKIPNDYLFYAGPNNGLAQVALAIIAKKTNKTAVIYLASEDSHLTNRAIMYGSIIMIRAGNLKTIQKEAERVCKLKGGYYCDFGFKDIERYLAEDIKKNLDVNIKNLWLVAGSGTILGSLYVALPKNVNYGVVQVGRKIWDDMLNDKSKLYVSSLKFHESMKTPYPTIASYDAKVWEFAKKHGKDGNHIWNVGSDIILYEGKVSTSYKKYIYARRLRVSTSEVVNYKEYKEDLYDYKISYYKCGNNLYINGIRFLVKDKDLKLEHLVEECLKI